jgi:hypothetical protein
VPGAVHVALVAGLAAGLVVLEVHLAEPVEADLVVLLEVDLAAVVRLLRVAEAPVVREALAGVALEDPVAAARTLSLIPRMAKFPTRWRLGRSPTT